MRCFLYLFNKKQLKHEKVIKIGGVILQNYQMTCMQYLYRGKTLWQ